MEKKRLFSKEIINTAIVASLSCGFLDALFERSSEYYSVSFLLFPPVTTAIVYFTAFLLFWVFAKSVSDFFFKLQKLPLAITLAFFLTVLFLRYTQVPNYLFSILGSTLFGKILVFLIPLSITISAYFLCSAILQSDKISSTFGIIGLLFPLILSETVICLWILKYAIKSYSSGKALLIYFVCICIAILLIWVFFKIKENALHQKTLYLFTCLVIVSPFIFLASETIFKSLVLRSSLNHRVKHIILIIDDTLRQDAVSCYNSESKLTPNIDNFSKEGIVFKNAISPAPWTLPAVASIMTGLPPSVHIVTTTNRKLSDNFETLAEKMKESGYQTAAIGYNSVLHHSYNMSQGFNEYIFYPKWYGSSFGKTILRNLFPKYFLSKPKTEELTDVVCQWLEKNRNNDFFLWIHYFDPHLPYTPPLKYLDGKKAPNSMEASLINREPIRNGKFVPTSDEKKWIKTLYDAEVSYVDENIGRLFETLKKIKLYDDSMIVFTSDHGEEFWEHGGFEHGHTVYNELLRVPLIIKMPFSSSGKIVENFVTTENLMPTILKSCDIPYDNSVINPDSLSGMFSKTAGSLIEEPIVSVNVFSSIRLQRSVIFNGMKYISVKVEENPPVEELYDLRVDPEEKKSIAYTSAEQLEEAKNILNNFDKISAKLRKKYDVLQKEEININKNVARELRTLGYIQ